MLKRLLLLDMLQDMLLSVILLEASFILKERDMMRFVQIILFWETKGSGRFLKMVRK